jgi:hypothetical protein
MSLELYTKFLYAIPPEWRSNDVKAALRNLDYGLLRGNFLDGMPGNEVDWIPGPGLVMAPFHLLPSPSMVKVAVLGHEPSPVAGASNGLAFGVREAFIDMEARPILCQKAVFGPEVDKTMRGLALEGVLLLNTCLTSDGWPNSHRYVGWRAFTRAIIAQLPAATVTWKLGSEARRNGYATPSTYVFSEFVVKGSRKHSNVTLSSSILSKQRRS